MIVDIRNFIATKMREGRRLSKPRCSKL